MRPTVLVIDDEKTFRIVVEEALSAEGFDVSSASSGETGLRTFLREPTDFVILDRNLPDVDGVKVLEELSHEARQRNVDTLVVMATAYADVSSAVQALKLGAFDYLAKPVRLPELIVTFRRALEAKRLRSQLKHFTEREKAAHGDIVLGESGPFVEVIDMVGKVAQAVDTTVLIQGESGTGKELVANMIHEKTPGRSQRPLIEINCASLPESLLESELFGHEKGAFTDAKNQKRGLFEAADGGTLFLDEVGELGTGTQAKLLKVLEEMTFRRLGGTRDLKVDVRVIAATNKDLALEVTRGAFRLDLYHRLDVFHLRLPPLRDRREDILPLATKFVGAFATKMKKPRLELSKETERILRGYAYPGNVRELKNLIERAVILTSGSVIESSAIVISGPGRDSQAPSEFFSVKLDASGQPPTLESLEAQYIAKLLTFAQGNRTQVARLLGVSYPTIAKKIADYGLAKEKA
ncbi:MAG TPA: sigma-54 dependent transcriptional regulator [Polyangiaceae bacterium]|jgi:DNA-binding NtrC family response regulator